MRIKLEGDTLQLQYGGGEIAKLKHWHYDTFQAQWGPRTTFVQFNLSPQGNVAELKFEIYRNKIIATRLP